MPWITIISWVVGLFGGGLIIYGLYQICLGLFID
jgi:hypothetical protein